TYLTSLKLEDIFYFLYADTGDVSSSQPLFSFCKVVNGHL
ncbi:MAG: hypothetical protein ACI90V_014470, partial [Bacillariaceae sp.]